MSNLNHHTPNLNNKDQQSKGKHLSQHVEQISSNLDENTKEIDSFIYRIPDHILLEVLPDFLSINETDAKTSKEANESNEKINQTPTNLNERNLKETNDSNEENNKEFNSKDEDLNKKEKQTNNLSDQIETLSSAISINTAIIDSLLKTIPLEILKEMPDFESIQNNTVGISNETEINKSHSEENSQKVFVKSTKKLENSQKIQSDLTKSSNRKIVSLPSSYICSKNKENDNVILLKNKQSTLNSFQELKNKKFSISFHKRIQFLNYSNKKLPYQQRNHSRYTMVTSYVVQPTTTFSIETISVKTLSQIFLIVDIFPSNFTKISQISENLPYQLSGIVGRVDIYDEENNKITKNDENTHIIQKKIEEENIYITKNVNIEEKERHEEIIERHTPFIPPNNEEEKSENKIEIYKIESKLEEEEKSENIIETNKIENKLEEEEKIEDIIEVDKIESKLEEEEKSENIIEVDKIENKLEEEEKIENIFEINKIENKLEEEEKIENIIEVDKIESKLEEEEKIEGIIEEEEEIIENDPQQIENEANKLEVTENNYINTEEEEVINNNQINYLESINIIEEEEEVDESQDQINSEEKQEEEEANDYQIVQYSQNYPIINQPEIKHEETIEKHQIIKRSLNNNKETIEHHHIVKRSGSNHEENFEHHQIIEDPEIDNYQIMKNPAIDNHEETIENYQIVQHHQNNGETVVRSVKNTVVVKHQEKHEHHHKHRNSNVQIIQDSDVDPQQIMQKYQLQSLQQLSNLPSSNNVEVLKKNFIVNEEFNPSDDFNANNSQHTTSNYSYSTVTRTIVQKQVRTVNKVIKYDDE